MAYGGGARGTWRWLPVAPLPVGAAGNMEVQLWLGALHGEAGQREQPERGSGGGAREKGAAREIWMGRWGAGAHRPDPRSSRGTRGISLGEV